MADELANAYDNAMTDIVRLEDELEIMRVHNRILQKERDEARHHGHLMANVAGIMAGAAAGLAAAIALTVYLK